jgi:hypothetical protein
MAQRTAPPLRLARAALAALALALAGPVALGPAGAPVLARAGAEEDWLAEFEAVCSRTQDAMSLPSDELRSLLARCDRLKPKVEALDPSRRKVYLRRLQLCRDLYRFVLDSREPG